MRPGRTPTSGCSSLTAASPITTTHAPMRLSGSRRLASTWFGSGRSPSPLPGCHHVPCDHAAEVPAVLPVHVLAVHQIQFTKRVPDISSCMQSWATLCGGTPFALCFVRQWMHILRHFPVCFWTFFLRVGGIRLLKSILSCSPCGRARRRLRLWYVLLGFWLRCTSPCVPFDCCRPGNGDAPQLMVQLLYLPESGNYFPCSHLCAVRALCRGVFGSHR